MTSVNKKEIDKFSKMANEWWDPEGKFKPLHKFNPTRIKYIKENIINNFKLKNKSKPLSGIKILDIGCGGGLLSEPMSRMGANVTGIDASDKNIKIAKLHSKKNNLKINYLCSSPEKLKIQKKFDVILNMEIVEHVEDIDFFLKSCSKLLKKNGLRAEIDLRNEKIGSKIRDHTLNKVPYMIVLGDREVCDDEITIRTQKGDDLGNMKIEDFLDKVANEIKN